MSVVEGDEDDGRLGWCFIRSARLQASAEIEAAAAAAAGIGVVVGGKRVGLKSRAVPCRACSDGVPSVMQ